MKRTNYEIIPVEHLPITQSGITEVLREIRPAWQGKNLIQRVERLLPIDPSSACQRLFNAAIHDLKEKIIILGSDLAKEIASNNKLPSINKDEDILEYNVSKTIDLAYFIGLLSRPEWRRIHRCYEIRRDLEHEDNEYEAVLEDCFYIFKTTINVVLSKDPIELLKVTDIKVLVETPDKAVVNEEILQDYRNAPKLRQKEIGELLISFAYDYTKPDIVRENAIELMRQLQTLTDNTVTIDLARGLEERIGRDGIDTKTAKIANACGAMPYFKKVRLRDFYNSFIFELKGAASDWNRQGAVCRKIEDAGGLKNCPVELYPRLLKYLVQFYLGEESYGPYKSSRPVFYSNSAAPIIARMIKSDAEKAFELMEAFREEEWLQYLVTYRPISKRFESLVDLTEDFED